LADVFIIEQILYLRQRDEMIWVVVVVGCAVHCSAQFLYFFLLNFGAAERVLRLPAVFLFVGSIKALDFRLPFKLIRSGVSLAERWRHFGPTFLELIQRFR
jgi:hypothetical protein